MSTETAFREFVRSNWLGWIEGREPRTRGSRAGWGSGNGAPDVELGVSVQVLQGKPRSLIFPVELKLGTLQRGATQLSLSGIETDQRKWHKRANDAGITTAFLAGVWKNGIWRAFIMPYASGSLVRELASEVVEISCVDPVSFTRMISVYYLSEKVDATKALVTTEA